MRATTSLMAPTPLSLIVQDVDLPALPLGEAPVHAVEIAREEARLVAAGAGANLEHDVLLVVRVLRHHQDADLGQQVLAAVMRLLQPGAFPVTPSGFAGASFMVVDSVRTGDIVVFGLA